jgi:hypothetical protein
MNENFFQVPADPLHLKNILEERTRACDKFLEITERLNNCLKAQELQEANQLLSERQELIRAIDRINDTIHRSFPEDPLEGFNQIPALKDHLFSAKKKMMATLEKAVVLNKNCIAEAKGWQNEIKEKLMSMRKGKKVLDEYAHSGVPQPRFMDIKK